MGVEAIVCMKGRLGAADMLWKDAGTRAREC